MNTENIPHHEVKQTRRDDEYDLMIEIEAHLNMETVDIDNFVLNDNDRELLDRAVNEVLKEMATYYDVATPTVESAHLDEYATDVDLYRIWYRFYIDLQEDTLPQITQFEW